MLIIDIGNADLDIVDDDIAVLDAFWTLNPSKNADVPIKKETVASIFPVSPGINAIGAPWLVNYWLVCCWAIAVILAL